MATPSLFQWWPPITGDFQRFFDRMFIPMAPGGRRVMKSKKVFVLGLLILFCYGCATTVKRPQVSYRRQLNTVEYMHTETGIKVKVHISDDFQYQNTLEAETKGVVFGGPLYSRGSDFIMVTRITADELTQLTGQPIHFKDPHVGSIPSETSFLVKNCQLSRHYGRSLGNSIIVGLFMRNLKPLGYPCESWQKISDIDRDRPGLIERFNGEGDRVLTFETD
jgi:hypothetical protein